MAITYVGGKTAGFVGSAATAVTVALDSGLTGGSDAGVSTDDLVVVTVGYGTNGGSSNPAPTNPTGYTALTQQAITSGTYDTNHRVAYKFMGGTPDTSVDIPPSTNIQWGGSYTIQVFRGVDLTTPLDVAAVYASAFNTNAIPNPGAITPVTSGAWIVVMGNSADPTGATFTTSDMTNFLTAVGSDNIDSMIGAGYYTGWTSGSFDPAIFGGGKTGSNLSWAATTLALRPASGGSSGPANLKSYDTNVKSNIKSINTNLLANIKSLNTNA